MPRKLKDIEVKAIALVDRAANKKKFYIIKNKEKMTMDFKEILKSIFGDKCIEEDFAKVEDLKDEQVQSLGTALEVFQKYDAHEFPEDVIEAMKDLVKSSMEPVEIEKEKGFTVEGIIGEMEKAGASLSKATRAQLERISTIIAGMLKSKTEKSTGDHKDLPPEVVAKLDELSDLKDKVEKERLEKEAEKEKEKEKDLDELKKQVAKLEADLKDRGTSKSITDDPPDENKDDEVKKKDKVNKWPSLG